MIEMIKIILAPDSFKGTMSATTVCDIMERAIRSVIPEAEIVKIPTADGGEGTVEALGAEKISAAASDPFFNPISSFYGDFNGSAVIETAACAGLSLARGKLDPAVTTTYGVGELILNALDGGYQNLILALGGSCTNDCGCGMAAALGVKFYNADGGHFIPAGKTLCEVAHIDISGLDGRIKSREVQITAMCDIENPLYGKNGAAYVFAPQKGAGPETVEMLDRGLRHISRVIKDDLGIDVAGIRGGGAAGGMGAGVYAFLGGALKSGIDIVLDSADFQGKLENCSLVISGEGKFDSQSVGGKVVSGIAKRTKKAGTPLVVIAGSAESVACCADMGITAVFSIQRVPLPFEQAVLRCEADLWEVTRNVIRLCSTLWTCADR